MASVTETVQIAARIPVDLRDDLERIAASEDRPLSWVIRQALRSYAEADNEKDAA